MVVGLWNSRTCWAAKKEEIAGIKMGSLCCVFSYVVEYFGSTSLFFLKSVFPLDLILILELC